MLQREMRDELTGQVVAVDAVRWTAPGELPRHRDATDFDMAILAHPAPATTTDEAWGRVTPGVWLPVA